MRVLPGKSSTYNKVELGSYKVGWNTFSPSVFTINSLPGAPLNILDGDYDARQTWLPFMHGWIVAREPEIPAGWVQDRLGRFKVVEVERPKPKKRRKNARPFKIEDERIHLTKAEKALYVYERDQMVLPFFEGRRVVGQVEFDALKQAGFPGWENVERKGRRVEVTEFIIRHPVKEVRTWCEECLQGRYFVEGTTTRTRLVCQTADDLVLARLRW